jgi:hypothetical protein
VRVAPVSRLSVSRADRCFELASATIDLCLVSKSAIAVLCQCLHLTRKLSGPFVASAVAFFLHVFFRPQQRPLCCICSHKSLTSSRRRTISGSAGSTIHLRSSSIARGLAASFDFSIFAVSASAFNCSSTAWSYSRRLSSECPNVSFPRFLEEIRNVCLSS